ncbi:hypothetical protein DM02DRAFT_610604 [Periconia macrospinosa]|uniref:Uncharacterized protein n=1 Tax=Periconia macrospinosa TaxID=97972 RepID=A0A2V1E664_9PLEO|nr:hypothetical protein DM02DRAFT_610604 [Periconia macrospinosa]
MVATRFIILAIASLVSATLPEEHYFASLLKRQEPGSPAYNCHDNCGSAITLSKAGGDVCKNEAFTTNYKNCLQCSGPDNFNIWRMYGNTLSKVGQGCGLSTTPVAGKQPDVGPAQHAAGGASSSSSSAPATPSSAGTTAAVISPSASTPAPTTALTTAPSAAPTFSGAPSSSRNGTASLPSSTPPAQQTANAGSGVKSPYTAGMVGVMFIGIVLGFAH